MEPSTSQSLWMSKRGKEGHIEKKLIEEFKILDKNGFIYVAELRHVIDCLEEKQTDDDRRNDQRSGHWWGWPNQLPWVCIDYDELRNDDITHL